MAASVGRAVLSLAAFVGRAVFSLAAFVDRAVLSLAAFTGFASTASDICRGAAEAFALALAARRSR